METYINFSGVLKGMPNLNQGHWARFKSSGTDIRPWGEDELNDQIILSDLKLYDIFNTPGFD